MVSRRPRYAALRWQATTGAAWMFNILIDNTDDHEKNHALMVVEPTRQGKYRLAPPYQPLRQVSRPCLKLTVGGQCRSVQFRVALFQRGQTMHRAALPPGPAADESLPSLPQKSSIVLAKVG